MANQHGGTATDKRLGFAIILGLVVAVGGVAMLIDPGEPLGATGFAVAIIAGLALIAALHLVE